MVNSDVPRTPVAPTWRMVSLLDKWRLFDRLTREASKLAASDFAVAFQILDHFNARRGFAWPSLKTLARLTGLARSTVAESIKRLIAIGVITKGRGYSGRANNYHVVWSFGIARGADGQDAPTDKMNCLEVSEGVRGAEFCLEQPGV